MTSLFNRWFHDPQRARVAVVGERRIAPCIPERAWRDALSEEADILTVPASSSLRGMLPAARHVASAIRNEGAEVVHLQDVRLVPAALLATRTHHVPLTCDLVSQDLRARSPLVRLAIRLADRLDQSFCSEHEAMRALRDRAPHLPVVLVPAVASMSPAPSVSETQTVVHALRGVNVGRPIVAVAWPEERAAMLRFCDFVLPRLATKPICIAFGVPDVRRARRIVRLAGAHYTVRLAEGPLTAGMIAAVARFADVMAVLPGPLSAVDDQAAAAITIASSGAPVVAWNEDLGGVLRHEENALLSADASTWGYVRLLDEVLTLPSLQRHFLGEEFRRATFASWPVSAAAQIYGERFAALTGRPRIPAELRAA